MTTTPPGKFFELQLYPFYTSLVEFHIGFKPEATFQEFDRVHNLLEQYHVNISDIDRYPANGVKWIIAEISEQLIDALDISSHPGVHIIVSINRSRFSPYSSPERD